MIRKILFLLPALFLLAVPARADSQGAVTPGTVGTQSTLIGCYYTSATPAPASGQQLAVHCDSSGNLLTSAGGGGGSNASVGVNGAASPASTTQVGSVDGSGNLQPASAANPLPTSSVGSATSANQTSQITQETSTATGIGAPGDAAYSGSGSAALIALMKGLYNVGIAPVTPACTSVLNITQTSTTDVLTSVAKLHICSILLVSATAQNIGVDEGTGTTCESSGTALIAVSSTASATPTMAVAANGGFSAISGIPFMQTKTTGDHLCIIQSGAGNVSGTITYVDN